MAKIVPIIILLIGVIVGGSAGVLLRPSPVDAVDCNDDGHQTCDQGVEDAGHSQETEPTPDSVYYAKLSKQFVVPVVTDGKVSSMVVMSLSLETAPEVSDRVFEREPKLRDALLGVMFLHANSGGFDGQFTGGVAMQDLRGSLTETAREIIGEGVYGVLVTDILRQDI